MAALQAVVRDGTLRIYHPDNGERAKLLLKSEVATCSVKLEDACLVKSEDAACSAKSEACII
jgi:hypothetical protein